MGNDQGKESDRYKIDTPVPGDPGYLGALDSVWTAYRDRSRTVSKAPVQDFQKNWMSTLPDSIYLDEIAIPGTHDTMTYTTSLPFACCQSWTLEQQLNSGIRFLDIRCHHMNDEYHVYHDWKSLGVMFTDVVKICRAFLAEHKSETILMRVRKEGEENCKRHFTDSFWINYKFMDLFADVHDITTLGEVRGKVVILKDFQDESRKKKEGEFGLRFKDAIVQDCWEFIDISYKERAIKAQYEAARARDPKHRQFAINFFSYSGERPPQSYSWHYNEMVWQILDPKCGIIVFDFPSQRHVLHIINLNNQVKYNGLRLPPAAESSEEKPVEECAEEKSEARSEDRAVARVEDKAEEPTRERAPSAKYVPNMSAKMEKFVPNLPADETKSAEKVEKVEKVEQASPAVQSKQAENVEKPAQKEQNDRADQEKREEPAKPAEQPAKEEQQRHVDHPEHAEKDGHADHQEQAHKVQPEQA